MPRERTYPMPLKPEETEEIGFEQSAQRLRLRRLRNKRPLRQIWGVSDLGLPSASSSAVVNC